MASINYAHKEIISKIVYYGPGLSGKTTNLQYVFQKIPSDTRGELISLATDADRTLYFDFLPLNVGSIQGFATKFQLYTVPGQVYYNATRKLVLRGVDGIVFVADSQEEKKDENLESLQNLKDNLLEYGYEYDNMPVVLQYNKRDLPNVMSIDELESLFNPTSLQYYEAVASTGEGVFKTLKAISKLVLDEIRKNKMGAPKAVKPKPVAVGVGAETQPQTGFSANESYQAEHSSYKKAQTTATEKDDSRAAENSVPEIVKDSETLANVVVSDAQQLPAEEDQEAQAAAEVVETTEQSILKDDTSEIVNEEIKTEEARPEKESSTATGPIYGSFDDSDSFDEEATQLSNLNLTNPIPFSKPQMAESKKVKAKKGKFNLFGAFKKKNK